jgi:hypothetical protein
LSLGQAARPGVVLAGVQGQEFGDLLQGEACGLGRADEAQATDVRLAVPPPSGRAGWSSRPRRW